MSSPTLDAVARQSCISGAVKSMSWMFSISFMVFSLVFKVSIWSVGFFWFW